MPGKSGGRRVAVSLFTGAGGLDLGVEAAGFDVLAAVERDPIACETLRHNFQHKDRAVRTEVFQTDIEDLEVSTLLERVPTLVPGEIDLLVGGPPCTPFSKSGYWIEYKRAGQDPDRFLLEHYVRFVRELRPRAFIMENVQALAYRNHNQTSLDALREALLDEGYNIQEDVLIAAEYGVPQVRQRLFLVGALDAMPELPHKTNAGVVESRQVFLEDAHLPPFVTSEQAFAGLPDIPESGEEVGGRYGHLLCDIPPGENYLFYTAERGHPNPLFKWRSRYWTFLLKLHPQRPSSTIQAQPGPYIGPFHWENRRLRIPELKALQTFPPDYEFHGSRRAVQVQIGNAVPPRLAECVAKALVESVFEKKHKKIA